MPHDNLPKKNPIWLLFDIDNGHRGSHHYVWWFDSRREAREFKAHHLASPNPHKTELVGPVRATVDKIPRAALKGTRLEPIVHHQDFRASCPQREQGLTTKMSRFTTCKHCLGQLQSRGDQ